MAGTAVRARAGVVVACAAHFLIGADGLAVAIALPAVGDDLGAGTAHAQWVLTAYGLAFGGLLLLGGRLGDLCGRRRMLAGVAFVVLNQEAVAEVEPQDRAWPPGGAAGVALYATIIAVSGYREAFLAAAGLAAAGVALSRLARSETQRPGYPC